MVVVQAKFAMKNDISEKCAMAYHTSILRSQHKATCCQCKGVIKLLVLFCDPLLWPPTCFVLSKVHFTRNLLDFSVEIKNPLFLSLSAVATIQDKQQLYSWCYCHTPTLVRCFALTICAGLWDSRGLSKRLADLCAHTYMWTVTKSDKRSTALNNVDPNIWYFYQNVTSFQMLN